jgi:hypothetical protein
MLAVVLPEECQRTAANLLDHSRGDPQITYQTRLRLPSGDRRGRTRR